MALDRGSTLFIFHKPIDFRCGHDKLAAVSRKVSGEDPRGGTFFVFRNRRSNAAKILHHDGTGYWLLHKRLSAGRFQWWPGSDNQRSVRLQDLHQLLGGSYALGWQHIGELKAKASAVRAPQGGDRFT